MKTGITIIVLLITCMCQAQYSTNKKRFDFYTDLSKQNSYESFYILTHIKSKEKIVRYADKATSAKGLLKAYGTVVHEACHELNFMIGRKLGTDEGYFIDTSDMIGVNKTVLFNSYELNKMVPDSLKKKIFRYPDYIGRRSIVSSQVSGIYGMLNEFTAYYHDVRCTRKLYPYLAQEYGFSDPDIWFELYCGPMGSQMQAYYEFRLFMAWYLLYAQEHYPEVYLQLMNNQPLRRAFTLVDDRFGELAANFDNDMESLAAEFRKTGLDVRYAEGGMRTYSADGSSWHGRSTFTREMVWLSTLMTPQLRQLLDNFRQKS